MFLISSDVLDNNDDVLEGVSYYVHGLVFYSSGLAEFKSSGGQCSDLRQGRFVIKYKQGNVTVIRSDEDGNELVFYFKHNDFWCVSTSFLALVWFLKRKGYPIRVSRLELSKLFIRTSLFEQPYNSNFAVIGVKLLDKNSEINIIDGSLHVVEGLNQACGNDLCFIDRVKEFIAFSRKVIKGFSENFEVDLELSGGVDSRMVLALAMPYRKNIFVSSDKNRRYDFLIAKFLSSVYGLRLRNNSGLNYETNNKKKKWLLYKLANVGVSRTNPVPNSGAGTRFSKLVRLNGAGGGSGKVFYNINSAAYLRLIDMSPLKESSNHKLKEDFNEALKAYDFAVSPQRAVVNLYADFRQRLFAGRAWYSSLLGVIYSPMNSRRYQSIIDAPDITDVLKKDLNYILEKNLVSLFILCLIDERLALIRFDEAKKDFNLDDVSSIIEITKQYKLYDEGDAEIYKCFGGVRNDTLIPEWLRGFEDCSTSDNSTYDDFLYRDIENVIPMIKDLDIINDRYLNELEERVSSKILDKSEKMMCLHMAEILKLADSIES